MLGQLVFLPGAYCRAALSWDRLCSMPVLRATIFLSPRTSARVLRRKLGRALCSLRDAGVRKVLLSEADGAAAWVLPAYGLSPVDTGPLCQALAPEFALGALRLCSKPAAHACVSLRASSVTKAFSDAAFSLCRRVRDLVIFAPCGGEALRGHLRSWYGLSALEYDSGFEPDVSLQFSSLSDGDRDAHFLLFGQEPFLNGFEVQSSACRIPRGFPVLSSLAVLYDAGRISIESLRTVPGYAVRGSFLS